MLAFFYSLYVSLMTGSWNLATYSNVSTTLSNLLNKVASLIVNTLGGNFESLQTFVLVDANLSAVSIIASILAIITLVMICFAVLKLVKMVFAIFFGGR